MKPKFKEILSDSLKVTSEIATEVAGDNPFYFNELIEISLTEKSPLNWRASRVILMVLDKYPQLFIPYINKIAQKFPTFKTDGLKRSYAYILSNYVKKINDEIIAGLINSCFDYMLSNEKIAVKYNCMLLLFEITKLIPELKGELKASIEYNLENKVFSMNGKIKKIYTKL